MSMAFTKTGLLRRPDACWGWITVARLLFCSIAALLNGIDIAFQGNGNWIWSGFYLGFILGLTWSASLVFGLSSLVRKLRPPIRVALSGASLLTAFIVLAIICVHLWGH
jgi:hypothetical protein